MRYTIELTFLVDAINDADAYAIAGQITDFAERHVSGYDGYSQMVATPSSVPTTLREALGNDATD